MKRSSVFEALMFVLLVVFGVAARIACQDIPNFAPVASVALFAGYFFRSRWLAAATPLSIMLLSDSVIGGYDVRVMVVVYAMLAAPVMLRNFVRRVFRLDEASLTTVGKNVLGLITCGLFSSIAFFLVTNLAVWIWFGGYDRSLAGFVNCYLRAIPFFRFTLASDALFSVLLFTSYATALQCGWLNAREDLTNTNANSGARLGSE